MRDNNIVIRTNNGKPKSYRCSECLEEYKESPHETYKSFTLWGLQLARGGQCFLCGIRASAPMTVQEMKRD